MNRERNALVGLILGILIGAPASYYLQSGIIRAKVPLGAYVQHLPELVKQYPGDMLPPVLISCFVLGIVGWFIGRRAGTAPQ
jgi:hypothetical protein